MKKICILAVIISVLISSFHCFAKNTTSVFTDVPEHEWFAESIEYVKDKGLMNGITVTTFEPQTSITRGMIVTIIYRLERSPKVNGELQFSDVNPTYYYCTPIIWASENGIVNGYSKDTFAPDDEITREQFATILYRYAKKKGINVSYDDEKVNLTNYEDEKKISDYAVNAISWAKETGLIKGVTVTTLEPQGKATRAQAATIFMRFDALLEQSEKTDISTESKDKKTDAGQPESDKNDDTSSNKGGGSKKDPTDKDDEKDEGKDDPNNGENNNDDDKNAGEWDDVKDENPGSDTPGNDSSKDEPTKDEPYEDENDDEEVYDNPTIVVESVSAKVGEKITVKVELHNNPGVLGAVLNFKFDPELELVDAQKGTAFSQLEMTKPGKFVSDCNFVWDGLGKPADEDGTVLTLYFHVSDNVKKGKKLGIKCSYLAGDIIDESFKELDIIMVDGIVTIE